MRLKKAALAVVTTTTAINAAAYQHHHRHPKRTIETVTVQDFTVKYIFDGKEVSLPQVCEGLSNGTFIWNPKDTDKPNCPESTPVSTATTLTKVDATPSVEAIQKNSSTSSATPESTPGNNIHLPSINFLQLLQENPGVDADFPDGQLPCTIDSLVKYGAVPLRYLGREGFTAIVNANIVNLKISDMSTDLTSGNDGSYFSYACPAGYMKAQWPDQDDYQTVGGVRCSDGKFWLTNPKSNKLCTNGAGSVNIVNKLDKVVSVCNTDYPATEDETVPTRCPPGATSRAAITDSGNFFKAVGNASTSAQYYLNPSGYDIEQACTWGSNDGVPIGNWAPINLGLGTDGANTVYIGLFSAEQVLHDPASPGKPQGLDYNIRVDITSPAKESCMYKYAEGDHGVFYFQTDSEERTAYLGQTFDGLSVPGFTCAATVGSDITVTFDR